MIALHKQLARTDGQTQTLVDDVHLTRSTQSSTKSPAMYDPCIAIALQGHKRTYFGNDILQFDADHYLVVAVPMPFTAATEASPEHPFLGISIRVDRTTLADLMFAIDQSAHAEPPAMPKGMMTTRMDDRLRDTVLRLLEALSSPLEARVLGPAIVREICYRVLMGDQGAAMRAALTSQGQFGRIAKALRRIHADYAANIDVGMLAAEANMSVPAFHVHFKSVTHCSPIQYLKSARLHQARLLMARSDMTAQAACAQVGYESPSQFSREFKRYFGRSPSEEVSAMRRYLTVQPIEPARLL
ncbi:helix-turn-helix domain-containing protein [Duganella sp. FT80W]|uniref:Helix-turn-helix domain-containing protein n=1 Tax=Duganella guangzhouensis TaxID=2666084 RepID=A0A6I2LAR0_9BURK|nr:AraC family transcriptional regulator [Duganella guangzhouensis]MRW94920.1 helix-turn-helix domain-containing protein [Duganella guangzhouensis]